MKKIAFFALVACLAIHSFAFAAQRPNGKRGVYFFTTTTGGTTSALDSLDILASSSPNAYDLIDGDMAIVGNQTLGYHFYFFDADSTETESDPERVRPDDYDTNGPGVWIEDTSIGIDAVKDGIDFNNNAILKTLLTTAGHDLRIGVYDANGATWRYIQIINGDSSDPDLDDKPALEIPDGVYLRGIKNMAVGMVWGNTGTPLTSDQDLEATIMNRTWKVGANMQANLPAAADCYNSGLDADWVQYIIIGDYTLSLNPDGTEKIRAMSSTKGVLAAGNELDTDGTAGVVTCYATDDVEDGSSTDGWICWSNVTLSDGGSS